MYDCCVYLPVVGSSSKDLLTPFSCAHSLLSVYGSPYHKKIWEYFSCSTAADSGGMDFINCSELWLFVHILKHRYIHRREGHYIHIGNTATKKRGG